MDFILKEEETGAEFLFPVTPSSYDDYTLMNAEKVNAYAVGDINLIGNAGTTSVTITALFPSGRRSYTNGSVYAGDPLGAREMLNRWCTGKKLLRLIIGGETTDVNRKCFISSLRWRKGGKDLTNDLYCDLKLSYYTDLETAEVNTDTGNNGRADDVEPTTAAARDYLIKKGDTLWDICKAEYGDGTLAYKLAEYNSIGNANLIYPGDALKLPAASELSGLTYTGSKTEADAGKWIKGRVGGGAGGARAENR